MFESSRDMLRKEGRWPLRGKGVEKDEGVEELTSLPSTSTPPSQISRDISFFMQSQDASKEVSRILELETLTFRRGKEEMSLSSSLLSLPLLPPFVLLPLPSAVPRLRTRSALHGKLKSQVPKLCSSSWACEPHGRG